MPTDEPIPSSHDTLRAAPPRWRRHTATALTVVAISLLTGIGEGLGRHLANGSATAVTAVVR